MISPLVFSCNRPPQLDLLLQSLTTNGHGLISEPVILWRSTSEDYTRGYKICQAEHPEARFVEEYDFESQTRRLIKTVGAEGWTLFACDDDVLYLPLDLAPDPCDLMLAAPEILCFSLRLGLNTTYTYPLDYLRQDLPPMQPVGQAVVWEWHRQSGDLGYPMSLDGHLFRKEDVLDALADRIPFSNPNTLEDALVQGISGITRPKMASWFHSALVGLPLNRVTSTHQNNRMGQTHYADPKLLNLAYLKGERISLDTVDVSLVNGAHVEMPLKWREKVPA